MAAGLPAVLALRANAAPTRYGYGYVWANQAASTLAIPYVPRLAYQANSTGAVNTVTRLNIGFYVVTFPSLGPGGTAMVTAYGVNGERPDDRCKIVDWFSYTVDDPRTEVQVRCYSRTGAAANSMFTATYTNPSPDSVARGAFVRNDRPSVPLNTWYTPTVTLYQYNSTGGTNTILRESTGIYRVRLAGLGSPHQPGRLRLVTALGAPGADPATWCSYHGDYGVTTPDADYQVRCHTSAGALVDSMFLFAYAEANSHLFTPLAFHDSASVVVMCSNDPFLGPQCLGGPSEFTTNPAGRISTRYVAPGVYDVVLPLNLAGGNVQVHGDGYGNERAHCKVAYWNSISGVRVHCYDLLGRPPAGEAVFQVAFARRWA